MQELSKYIIQVNAEFKDGEIVPEVPYKEVMRLVNEPNIVIVKSGIPEATLKEVIDATWAWGQAIPASENSDTFDNNQHKRRW